MNNNKLISMYAVCRDKTMIALIINDKYIELYNNQKEIDNDIHLQKMLSRDCKITSRFDNIQNIIDHRNDIKIS